MRLALLRPLLALAVLAAVLLTPLLAQGKERSAPASGVIGVSELQLRADYWIVRAPDPDLLLTTPAKAAAQNARLLAEDPSMHDLAALPGKWPRALVAGWIEKRSTPPTRALVFTDGVPVTEAWMQSRVQALDLAAIPGEQAARFGLVLRRASLRTFPDATRVFSADATDRDIDRFQETALFAGTPVAIAHRSADGRWLFVLAPNYAAWIEADAVAEGEREQVLGYATRQPARVLTEARASTVFTPEDPRVSESRLEMGMRLPLAAVPADAPVNGQHPYTSWPLLLPVRGADGRLDFAPALLPKTADSASGPLPHTRANLLRQAFKFLGERYGWGHDFNGRDCSGFAVEVYRSVGIELPRNTGDQARSPVLANRTVFGPGDDRAARERALAKVRPGDLLYIPGHMMIALGHVDGQLYVIHDIQGGTFLDASGAPRAMHLNGVSVTPFAPLRFDEAGDFTDRLTAILRIP